MLCKSGINSPSFQLKGEGKECKGKKGRGRKGKDTHLLKLKEQKNNTELRSSLHDPRILPFPKLTSAKC